MHASARCRAVPRVHLPALELSRGGSPPGSRPSEPSPRRQCPSSKICLTQGHHHLHLLLGRGSGGTGYFRHASWQLSASSASSRGHARPQDLAPGGKLFTGNRVSQRGLDTSTPGAPPREDNHFPGCHLGSAPTSEGACFSSDRRSVSVLVPDRKQGRA